MAEAAWHPDPTGRHESRWWDGRTWTDHVADGGATAADPPTWPPAPPATGFGLASGSLWYQRGDGRIPWAVVDGLGAVAGWVVPPAGVLLGPQEVPLLDAAHAQVLTVAQALTGGTRVRTGGMEVARLRQTGVGGTGHVAWSVDVAGSSRARLQADLASLHAGPVPVVDRGGTPIATLAMRWNADGGVDLHLARLTVLPREHDLALLALPIALVLELEDRAAFASSERGLGEHSDSTYWPGL